MKLIFTLTTLIFSLLLSLPLTPVHATPTNPSPLLSHTNPTLRSLQKRCPPFDPAGTKNIGNGAATQFVGGQCLSDADCQQGCCAKPCGICSGPGAKFQNGKQGCGFGGSGSGTASAGAGAANANANTASTAGSGAGNGNANTNSNTDSGDDSNASSQSNNNNNGNGNGSGKPCSDNISNA